MLPDAGWETPFLDSQGPVGLSQSLTPGGLGHSEGGVCLGFGGNQGTMESQ